ncbi:hypothetical protein KORDIASMS9_00450 [Kordia sp. SMS9]|uniref:hypothetical protein n=1 Tax=Kordia sp. SMS9 TaxID=2282170 RepID=UPI000E0D38F0|nr:hypothetical protein [Kordia sp. SMS9]AXG68257.1 hypothetical protein KORDIASMS9_00450 [Kordia sp. SMS9]
MKKNYSFLFILICCFSFSVFSQESLKIEDEYYAYFKLPREGLYLHLNKTTYFQGEEIWFKGYAYDQRNQLASKATTNINIGIYDAAGNQLQKHLFAAENGVTNGNFAVDSTFTAGTYYIKAETNWMKNFKEDNAYIQKIEIKTNEQLAKSNATEEKQYDFQFLPEGGHILTETINNVGFKIIDNNGKGVAVSGIVYDQEKNQVASFESNTVGMGKFILQPKKEAIYTAEITLKDGTMITKELPSIQTQGISLIIQNSLQDKVILDFSTNEETLTNYPNKTYKILIHQNGQLKIAALQFSNLKKAVSIEKERLFKGVNTITVFDDQKQPILERLFFNDYGIKNTKMQVSKLNTIKDSIILSVKELNLQNKANVSISVLPETTQGYNPQHNIISNFYLKPHVSGFIENPQYYFHKMDRKKKYELDVLLLTQGWSRYDWNDIFGKKPTATHRFENGIGISGRVNRPATGVKQVFLYETKNHAAKFIDLDENQKFELANVFLEEGEEIKFSYITPKGALKKPGMYLRFLITNKEDKISEAFLENTKKLKSDTANFKVPENFFYENAEELDAVVLNAEKEKPKYNSIFLMNPSVTEITIEEYKRYLNLVQYLNFNGFNASEDMGNVFISSRIARGGSPTVFFNDVRLNDLNILYSMSLAEIERIVVDRYSRVPSARGGGLGVIKIYSRITPLFKKPGVEIQYLAATSPASFSTGKKYYAPNYSSYLNPVFQKYGAISWLPTVELNSETATTFKIYDTYTKNVTLFIEGIAENGDLISERKTIQVR